MLKSSGEWLPSILAGCDNPGLPDDPKSPRLWGIMDQFYAAEIVYCVHQLCVLEGVCVEFNGRGFGASKLPENFQAQIDRLLDQCLTASEACEFPECSERVSATIRQINKPFTNITTYATALNVLKEDIMSALKRRSFLRIPERFAELVDQDELFGPTVAEAFPSAGRDIREAGNCLAAGCGTACVFHLMRAAEFTLRALAKDRGVWFKDKPLAEKEWGAILPNLASKLDDLRSLARYDAKEAQIRYYSELVQELRSFNDAWRRHISHADTMAFYEPDEAFAIFKHVRSFMQKVSLRITEEAVTKEKWQADPLADSIPS